MPIHIKGSGGSQSIPTASVKVENNYNSSHDIFVGWRDLDGKTNEARLEYGESVTFETNKAFVVVGGWGNMLCASSNVEFVSKTNSEHYDVAYAITPIGENCSITFS